ncbi:MAG: T9SS type A sorting domain-containing protein [bacterium]|nr:T9SS type A sorting domain-containing protein [bacterium]
MEKMRKTKRTMQKLLKKNFIMLLAFIFTGMLSYAGNNSTFLSMSSVPSSVVPGQTFTVNFYFKNTGTTIWETNGNYSWWLGSENSRDNFTWGTNRAGMVNKTVNPGGTFRFRKTFTAPTTPGSYNFQWKMLQNYVEWFGAKTTNKVITVVGPVYNAGIHSKFISQTSIPTTLNTGQAFTVSFTFKNTGTITWTPATKEGLTSQNAACNNKWGTVVTGYVNRNVYSGQTYTFTHTFTAPSTAGEYNFQWKTSRNITMLFGKKTPNVIINVGANTTDDAEFRSIGFDHNFSHMPVIFPSYPLRATIEYKNTGTSIWKKGIYYLASEAPQNNTIWGYNRLELPYNVAPGATVSIVYDFITPATIGYHPFQWRMSKGGNSRFGETSDMENIHVIAVYSKSTTPMDENSAININIMPNPASNLLKIKLPTVSGKQILKLYDITGKIIYNNEYFNTENIDVNVSEFKKGIYFLLVENETNSYREKVIIN